MQDGMEKNITLVYLDLRFTGSSQEAEYAISQQIEQNQERLRLQLTDQPKVSLSGFVAQETVIHDSHSHRLVVNNTSGNILEVVGHISR